MKKTDNAMTTVELAITVFDWITDGENYELAGAVGPVFSVKRLCQALGVERNLLDGALLLLEQNIVIGRAFTDGRKRELRPIKQAALEQGSRQRLIAILKPEPQKLYVPHGPATVLAPVNVYCASQLLSFKAGEVVTNELHIRALLGAGASIAKAADVGARLCENKKCQHRFDVNESPAVDHPVFECVKRCQFTVGSVTVFLSPGDLVADRQKCLAITGKTWVEQSVRELSPKEYTACPRCKTVSKRVADLQPQLAKAVS